nr:cytochrome c [Candidatus Saccharibacteria bacterium]NIV71805.1 c-type cytochrome [Calditrichia bacterium]NIW78775.1 c-type cytochrome [Calditrichia bacterium]
MSKNSKKTGLVLLTIFSCSMLFAQSSGETTFKQVCAACHTIAQGKLVGPDLANVHQRRSEDWLIKFIKSSQSVVNSGDSVALQLFNEFNQLIMPDNNLTEEQIKSVIQYIASQSPAGKEAPQTTASAKNSGKSVADASEREIKRGERLFAGKHRLSNGGPTCNSCHHVKNDNIIAG